MSYLAAYVVALLAFGILDAAWLSTVGATLYKSALGDLLAPEIRMAPALVFYLSYPIGLVAFGVLPGLRADSAVTAAASAALFGALAYGTYDLTNHAVMRVWSTQITAIDIVYGAVASGIAALVAYFATRAISGWLGLATP